MSMPTTSMIDVHRKYISTGFIGLLLLILV